MQKTFIVKWSLLSNKAQLLAVRKMFWSWGCSTGYGLSRITAAFGSGAHTLGVCFEKEPTEKRTGTAGWYNTAAFHQEAENAGLQYHSINGDAFSDEIKQETIDYIKQNMGKIDLVVYSAASPKRKDQNQVRCIVRH